MIGNISMQTTTEKETVSLIHESLKKAQEYPEYREMVNQLALEGKTTGAEQTDSYVEYTQLNNRRMNRWDKTLKFSDEVNAQIKAIDKKLKFVVLTESWCGDAAPSMPVMHKMAALNPNIDMKVVLRDENLELMDRFLTNGARSIPKLILVDQEKQKVLGKWGPRPKPATQMVQDYKAEHGKLTAEFRQDLQVWYNKNKGEAILNELLELLALK